MAQNQYEIMAEWAELALADQARVTEGDTVIDAQYTFQSQAPCREVREIPGDVIFIRDLMLDASIGIYAEERKARQPVLVSIEAELYPRPTCETVNVDSIVCYDKLVQGVLRIVDCSHIDLVETLAEDIARFCLSHERVMEVTISASKPAAIAIAGDAGVRITRARR